MFGRITSAFLQREAMQRAKDLASTDPSPSAFLQREAMQRAKDLSKPAYILPKSAMAGSTTTKVSFFLKLSMKEETMSTCSFEPRYPE